MVLATNVSINLRSLSMALSSAIPFLVLDNNVLKPSNFSPVSKYRVIIFLSLSDSNWLCIFYHYVIGAFLFNPYYDVK